MLVSRRVKSIVLVGNLASLVAYTTLSLFNIQNSTYIEGPREGRTNEVFHVVQYIPYLDTSDSRYRHIKNTHNTSKEAIVQQRQTEIVTSLQRTLASPLVGKVHVLYDNECVPKLLTECCNQHRQKIVLQATRIGPTYKDVFGYVSDNLVNRDVLVMHSDVYLGQGFQLLNSSLLSGNIFYAISRSAQQEKECYPKDECCPGKAFQGSADLFVFKLHTKISREILDMLDYPPYSWGAENKLMWIFREKLHYRVLNPCRVLKAYHYHCTGVRADFKTRKHVAKRGMWAVAYCSDRLM